VIFLNKPLHKLLRWLSSVFLTGTDGQFLIRDSALDAEVKWGSETLALGIGAPPAAGIDLYIESAANPAIRIREAGNNAGSYFQIENLSDSQSAIDIPNGITDGDQLFDINVQGNGTGNSTFRFNRATNVSGTVIVSFMRGDGANTTDHSLTSGTSGTLVDLCQNGGGFTVNSGMNLVGIIAKTANETVVNSTTLQNDDHLVFAGIASADYTIEYNIMCGGPSAADIDFAITVPTGATAHYQIVLGPLTTDPSELRQSTTTGLRTGTRLICWVDMDTTAGNIQLQWAQGTADAGTTTVYRGSMMTVWEI